MSLERFGHRFPIHPGTNQRRLGPQCPICEEDVGPGEDALQWDHWEGDSYVEALVHPHCYGTLGPPPRAMGEPS
jgi:hypothetical protein